MTKDEILRSVAVAAAEVIKASDTAPDDDPRAEVQRQRLALMAVEVIAENDADRAVEFEAQWKGYGEYLRLHHNAAVLKGWQAALAEVRAVAIPIILGAL